MKLSGFLLAFALLVIYFFAPLRIIQFSAISVVIVLVLDSIYLKIIRAAVSIERSDTLLRGYCGVAFEVEIAIANRAWIPVYGAVLNDDTGVFTSEPPIHRLLSISAHKRQKHRYSIVARERGEYALGPASLKIRSVFRRNELRISSKEQCTVIIFPRLVRLEYVPDIGLPQGALPSKNLIDEDLTRYRSIRDYIPGDEFKRINWKVAAKTGKFATNQYELLLEAPLCLILNIRLSAYPLKKRYNLIEAAISIAASLAVAAINRRQTVALHSNGATDGSGDAISIDNVANSPLPILDVLARIKPSDSKTEFPFTGLVGSIPLKTSLVYIGPDIGEDLYRLNDSARKRGGRYSKFIVNLSSENENEFSARRIPTCPVEKYQDA